jgi:hypothetical protein
MILPPSAPGLGATSESTGPIGSGSRAILVVEVVIASSVGGVVMRVDGTVTVPCGLETGIVEKVHATDHNQCGLSQASPNFG